MTLCLDSAQCIADEHLSQTVLRFSMAMHAFGIQSLGHGIGLMRFLQVNTNDSVVHVLALACGDSRSHCFLLPVKAAFPGPVAHGRISLL